jgi:flagellar hook-basal body complex protein FliE
MTASLPPFHAAQALSAYQTIDKTVGTTSGSGDFGSLLSGALSGAIDTGKQADQLATKAISGNGDLTHVITAVSRASLALQSTVAIRDRVLQAYQDIIKMPI